MLFRSFRTSKFAIRNLIAFPVVVSRGSHPFPSRTRKLSLLEPMVLRGKLRGRVGSRRIKFQEARSINFRAGFLFCLCSGASRPSFAVALVSARHRQALKFNVDNLFA